MGKPSLHAQQRSRWQRLMAGSGAEQLYDGEGERAQVSWDTRLFGREGAGTVRGSPGLGHTADLANQHPQPFLPSRSRASASVLVRSVAVRFPGRPHWGPVSLSQCGPNVVDEDNCLGRREGDWDRGAGYKSRFLV